MMKKTKNKLLGSIAVVTLLATIGSAFVTAETSELTEDKQPLFEQCPTWGPHDVAFGYELTEDQQAELESLRETLKESNATFEEIDEAIAEKLAEFGFEVPTRDDLLEHEIEQTTQRLSMLNRKQELREQGYSWEEIQEIIAEEYEVEFLDEMHPCGMHGGRHHGFPGRLEKQSNEIEESLDSDL